jgi:hypothetical protein
VGSPPLDSGALLIPGHEAMDSGGVAQSVEAGLIPCAVVATHFCLRPYPTEGPVSRVACDGRTPPGQPERRLGGLHQEGWGAFTGIGRQRGPSAGPDGPPACLIKFTRAHGQAAGSHIHLGARERQRCAKA